MRWLAILLLLASPAWATSSINTAEPSGSGYVSAPIRQNFQAFANDVNALQNCNRGPTMPSGTPAAGNCWLNVSRSDVWCYELYTTVWTPILAINPLTNTISPANVPGCYGYADALGLNTGAPYAALGLNTGSAALGLNH